MKRIIIFSMCFFLCLSSLFAIEKQGTKSKQKLSQTEKPIQTKEYKICYNSKNSIQRRGCCSWHGGVCGCVGGRAKCCDGTLSPTCGCD